MANSCVLPPTMPITMQVESAGYTERGGMLNGLSSRGLDGMGCVVLPVGTRVTMEFWGEPGEAEMIEIGFPTFVSPGRGRSSRSWSQEHRLILRIVNCQIDLSGWVLTHFIAGRWRHSDTTPSRRA